MANHVPLISVKGLYKSFQAIEDAQSKLKNHLSNRIDVLNGLDFDLYPGETVAIVGASGIGKSTLLHILGTLDRPDSGTLLFEGQDVFKLDDHKLAKLRNESIGFVFQFHYLLPEFSALENVMMPALINGEPKTSASAAPSVFARIVRRTTRLRRSSSKPATRRSSVQHEPNSPAASGKGRTVSTNSTSLRSVRLYEGASVVVNT